MGSQEQTPGSTSCRTIQRYGRPRPWPTISTRSRSFLTRWLEPLTSTAFLVTRSTPQASQPLLGSRTSWRRLPGRFTPKGKIIWLNLRQEPVVYANGNPICARPPSKIGEYAELGDVTSLVHMRVPICNSASPLETDFDIICATLVGSSINTPVIVNDQVGLSRATTGCVIACLFKEFQINASFEG